MNLSNERSITLVLLTSTLYGTVFLCGVRLQRTIIDLQVEKVILTLNAQVSISEAGHQEEL